MKIKSVTDIITNSSSETFCRIDGPIEELEKLKEVLGDWSDCCGDGGVYICTDEWEDEDEEIPGTEPHLDIEISYSARLEEGGMRALRLGLKEILKPYLTDKIKVDYED